MNEFNLKIKELTPNIIKRFKTAISIGKWPDGSPVNDNQKEILTQAIIIYDDAHTPVGQRVGDLDENDCPSKNIIKDQDPESSDHEINEIKWQQKKL
jgi:uncharacterized protein YeaC (DUF1315 family)